MAQQGRTANIQGRTLESAIINIMSQKGFDVVPYRDWEKRPGQYSGELLLKNVPYETLYGHRGSTEFKIVSGKYGDYRIECKWQQTSGSVDEKFPYLYLNCIEKMPEENIIVVVDGSGAKHGAVEWLKNAAERKLYTGELNRGKNIRVMNLAEFLAWANRTFRD